MDRHTNFSRYPHYHIRWTGSALLDWEPFSTAEEAEANAVELMSESETYAIEKCDENCPRCAEATKRYRAGSQPS